MKIYARFLPALLTALLLAAVPAHAQDVPAVTIGIVDMSVIISKSKAYLHLREGMEKRAQALQVDAGKLEKELTKQRDDLSRQKTLLSPESFKQRQEEFQKKFMARAQKFDERQKNLRLISDKATVQIQQKLAEIAGTVAQARGINLVITGGSVLYAIRGYDLTEDVLKQLDEKLPKVTLAK